MPFQSLDPPLESVTERASVRNELFQLGRVPLGDTVVGGIDGSRMEFGNTRDAIVELLQATLDGGDLEWVGKSRIRVGGLLGLGNPLMMGNRPASVAHGNERRW